MPETATFPRTGTWKLDPAHTFARLWAEFDGVVNDPWGNEKAIFSARTAIDREEWGLTWNQVLETGNLATLLVLIAGTAAFICSGAYDVSATSGHIGMGRWVLNALQERSIAVRADGVPEPPAAEEAEEHPETALVGDQARREAGGHAAFGPTHTDQ